MNAGSKLKSRWYRINGLKMHARVSESPPDAPAVVLVHGVGISGLYMVPLAERLAPYCRVYVPDLPGFGESDKPNHFLDSPELTDSLAGWLEAAGLTRANFLGNSFGCQIIVDLAVRYPEKVEKLVLQGPTIDPKGRSALVQIGRWMRMSRHEPFSHRFIMLRDYTKAGFLRVLRTFRISLDDRIEEKLPRVQAPTLIVRYYNELKEKIPARYPLPGPLTLNGLEAFLEEAGDLYPVQWLSD